MASTSFYSTGEATKTNIPLWSWKRFPMLYKTTFCAILLAFCYVIPKRSWCRCSSCGQDWAISDAPYTSPGYETKWAGSTIVSAQRTFANSCVSQNLLTLFAPEQWCHLHLRCWHRRKGTLWSAVEVLTYRRDTTWSELLILLINSTVLIKWRQYLTDTGVLNLTVVIICNNESYSSYNL